MIKTDAQHECERFGEEKSGTGGAHECSLQ
jgi:hypothetical protein